MPLPQILINFNNNYNSTNKSMPRPHPKAQSASLGSTKPSSRHSSARKPALSSTKMQPHWPRLLQQISEVTQKVRQLCAVQDQPYSRSKNSSSQNIRSMYKNKAKGAVIPLKQNSPIFQPDMSFKNNSETLEMCNSNCHQLMYECMKLSKQNRRLAKDKENLEKKLYFQSKEKRELRWKLEKEKSRSLYNTCNRNRKENTSVQFRPYNEDNNQNSSIKLSEFSELTAKKVSPLKQRGNLQSNSKAGLPSTPKNSTQKSQKQRIFRILLQNKEDSKADSLLLDISQADEQGSSQNLSTKVGLEKELHQLLEVSKYETDRGRKKQIRKQMQAISEQLKGFK